MKRIIHNNIKGVFFTDSEIELFKENIRKDVVERKELINHNKTITEVVDTIVNNADSKKGLTY